MSDLISRADAIKAIDDAIDADSPQWAILRTKIGFLPSAELPKGELISRADAIERIVNDNVVGGMDRVNEYRNSNEHNDYLDGISCAIATVDDVPSAETHEIRTETHGVYLISKDDAMGAVQDHFNANGFKGYDDGQKMMDRIKALPSAEAEIKCVAQIKVDTEEIVRRIKEEYDITDRWIPCSERLPSEKDGQVLVTKCGEVRIATYSEFSGTWYVGEMCAVGGEDPIAWMPLPMPYREDGE